MVSGQLKQTHVLVGNRVEGATGQQHQRNTASHFSVSHHIFWKTRQIKKILDHKAANICNMSTELIGLQ